VQNNKFMGLYEDLIYSSIYCRTRRWFYDNKRNLPIYS